MVSVASPTPNMCTCNVDERAFSTLPRRAIWADTSGNLRDLDPGRVNCQTRAVAPRARCMNFFLRKITKSGAQPLRGPDAPVPFRSTLLNLVPYAVTKSTICILHVLNLGYSSRVNVYYSYLEYQVVLKYASGMLYCDLEYLHSWDIFTFMYITTKFSKYLTKTICCKIWHNMSIKKNK